jgi:glycosyltransferase involved in cell wall biosynthesis
VESRVLSLDDGSLVPHCGLVGKITTRFDWMLNGTINRRSRGTVLTYHRRQIWNPEVEIQSEDIVHLHSITGFIGDRGLRHLLRNRPRVFWTAHNPWLFTGGCVAYAGCDRFETGCKRCPLLKFPLEGWAKGELKAKVKFWRDYGVQPIANSEWTAAMMRRSPLFEGMDIPVIPPIVDEVFFATTHHTNLHERAEPLIAQIDTYKSRNAGPCLDRPSGASESDSLASELADSPVSELLIRSADGPALARLAPGGVGSDGGNQLADSAEILEGQSQAGSQMGNQKNRAIRLANAPGASGENSSSVCIRDIRGQNSATLAARRSTLDSPMPRWAGGSRFVVGLSARSLTDGGKGIEEFFQRLPLDRAFLKETTFVLIGEGEIRVPAGLDCRFLGLVVSPERLAEIYRMLDLFVSASAMETFGMAILEAQACGTPVVAFETGGTPEAVCSSVSRLVPNGNFPELFRVVEEMFDTARSSGGKNRKLMEWVAARHGWQTISEKQVAIYSSLLKRG